MRDFLKNSDSTELLLDAMCNIFGVILLTAIIIGGVSISEKLTRPDKVSKTEFTKLREQCTLLDTELKAASTRRELLNSLLGSSPAAVQLKLDSSLQKSHRQLVGRVNDLAEKIESINRQLIEAETLQKRLKSSTAAQEKALIAKLSRDLQQNQTPKPAQYAVTSTGVLTPWRLIVDNEKFYIVGTNRDIHRGSTENSHVNISSFKQGKHRFFRISKRPEKGIALNKFSLQTLQIPPDGDNRYFVELSVEENAVAKLPVLLQVLRQNKLLFSWRAIPTSGAMLRTAERGDYEVTH